MTTLDWFEAEDRRRQANLPRLEAIIARARALATCPDSELAQAANEMKTLQLEWRALGGPPRDRADELSTSFSEASDRLHLRAHAEFAQRDLERQANLQKKLELCVRAEALVDAPDWKAAADTMKALQDQWRSIGAAPRQQSEAVWLRFRRAADQLFARRESDPQSLRDANLAARLASLSELCQRAEAVQDSCEWKAAADLLKALQAEWRQVRPAGLTLAEADALWQRFRAACDHFFERRQAALLIQDQERRSNLAAKEALVTWALALAEDPARVPDPEEAVGTLMREWKAIGSVPRDQSEQQWGRFCAACAAIDPGGRDAPALPRSEGRPGETTPPME